MKKVDSQALGVVLRSLGLTGAGAQETEFTDGTLDQVIDVGDLIRRGRTPGISRGVFYGIMQTIHTDAQLRTVAVEAYTQSVGVVPPFPTPIPESFDLWLMAAVVRQISGTGTLSAALFLTYAASQQAWGEDSAGAAVAATGAFTLAYWDGLITQTQEFGVRDGKEPFARMGIRLTPGAVLTFSATSSATSVFNCYVLLGLFPAGMGQDVIS